MRRFFGYLHLFGMMHRTERDYIEDCIQTLLEEAQLSSSKLSLGMAAFRLKQRVKEGGIFLTFDQAFYRLRRRDRDRLFVRSK